MVSCVVVDLFSHILPHSLCNYRFQGLHTPRTTVRTLTQHALHSQTHFGHTNARDRVGFDRVSEIASSAKAQDAITAKIFSRARAKCAIEGVAKVVFRGSAVLTTDDQFCRCSKICPGERSATKFKKQNITDAYLQESPNSAAPAP